MESDRMVPKPWASHVASLCLNFPLQKMGTIRKTSWLEWSEIVYVKEVACVVASLQDGPQSSLASAVCVFVESPPTLSQS